MPTIVLHLPHDLLSKLAAAGPDGTVELSLDVRTGEPGQPEEAPQPSGPLAPLLRTGLLAPGTRLHLHQPRANRSATATVHADGTLTVEGKLTPFRSPSKAAFAVTQSQANGWLTWRLADGRTLDDLRDELEQSEA
ncbi:MULTISPECIES: DUF4357 domain-containing protein [Streptomyces]|uniref:DUF4357 domain-containing protein n=1 Tax=Streptomyces koelreuteriae TaxID=2838015 RepID=A0ABX8FUX7_9ACTN|nr:MULTISPECIES: DUF4357 domain-containing protein [Streptomyces]QWB25011.1 DUF4357 domain-containing protein [Streptomyces koelreuteriae]UUA08040.1 DUF4357 domain-containing protein [Streptomyces koelreuteriae]UUA15647.1 DUF4357 domain-containing protein [Streptomyces sp. CRCS-T-1]